MKKIITPLIILVISTALFNSGCTSRRVYVTTKTPHRVYSGSSVSLIINPAPGSIINRHTDGRFYYRSSNGLIYWKGYDNRFYLDRNYIRRYRYNKLEYGEWRKGCSRPVKYRRW